jgi:folate-dependent phosphoribosylglycinamide formyltransferase PurN
MKLVENHIIQQDDGKSYSMGYDPVTDLADTYMGEDATIGDIFRASQKEHGRCVSKVYQDTDEGIIAVGWVFQKRERYEDSRETYIHETWISLYDEWTPTIIKKPHVIS